MMQVLTLFLCLSFEFRECVDPQHCSCSLPDVANTNRSLPVSVSDPEQGGGMFIDSSTGTLTSCTFTSNSAGGAITSVSSTVSLYGVFFSSNTAGFGADICPSFFDTFTVYSTCPAGFSSPSKGSAIDVGGTVSGSPFSYTCSVCSAGSYKTASSSACTSCDAGRYLSDAATSPLLHDEASDCVACGAGKYSESEAAVYCSVCSAGKFLSDPGTSSILHDAESDCSSCLAGKFLLDAATTASLHDSEDDCIACDAGKYGASATSLCSSCVGPTYTSMPGQTICTSCSGGNFANEDHTACLSSSSCEVGFGLSDDAGSCIQCPFGKYKGMIAAAQCTACVAGKSTSAVGSTSASECSPCSVGKYNQDGIGGLCTDCAAGKANASSGSFAVSACIDCDKGKFAFHQGLSVCSICEAGKYADFVGMQFCSLCDNGKTIVDDALTVSAHVSALDFEPCVPGKFANLPSLCDNCPVGKANANFGSTLLSNCVSCASGQENSADFSTCLSCSVGKYNPSSGATCIECGVGKFLASTGALNEMSCQTCLPGTSTNNAAGSSTCTDCAPGRAAPSSGFDQCDSCVGGTYAAGSKSVRCVQCEVGKYADTVESSSCRSCEPGKHATSTGSITCALCLGGEYGVNCAKCVAGRYSNPGSAECSACTVGFVSSEGKGNCEYCGPGKYAEDNDQVCRDCGVNFFSVGGANSCSPCENGGHSDEGASSCEKCLTGRYFDREKNDCLACQSGRYSDTGATDKEGCKPCDAGFISDSSGGAGFCSPCAAGKFSSPDRATCEKCSPGKISGIASVQCTACETGKYADGSGNVSCKFCDDHSALKGSTTKNVGSASALDCGCNAGEFKSDSTMQCERVTEGIIADTFGMNVTNLILEAGFWRTSRSSFEILPCLSEAHCKGGNDPFDICAVGYEGPLCAVCKEGYAPRGAGRGFVCELCSGSASVSVGVGVALLLIFLLVALYYLCRKTTEEDKHAPDAPDRSNSCFKRLEDVSERHAERFQTALQLLKMFIAYFQIVGGLAFAFDLNFPPMFTSAMDFLSGLVNVNFISLMPLGCILPTNYHKALLGYTLIPLFVSFVLFVIYVSVGKNEKKMGLRIRLYGSFLVMTFMILPTVSVKIFSIFACKTFDGSYGRYLKVDYSIDCDSSEHSLYAAYAVGMILVYPVGIPLMYYVLLLREKGDLDPSVEVSVTEAERSAAALNKREAVELRKPALKRLSFLYSAYTPRYWWFEVFETLRKLALTGLLVLVSPGSAGQIVISMLVCMFSMRVYSECKPFLDGDVYFVFEASQWQLFMTMFAALAIRVNIDDEGLEDKRAFDIALFVVQFIAPAAVLLASFLHLGGVDTLSRWSRKVLSGRNGKRKVEDLTIVTLERATEMNRIGNAEWGEKALKVASRGDTVVVLGD